MSSLDNPAYKGERSAGGIYVDGGQNVAILNNELDACDIGIEVASEATDKSVDHITVLGNRISNSWQSGILVGGYNVKKCEARVISIERNDLIQNDRAGWNLGEMGLQLHVEELKILNNDFHPRDQSGAGYAIGRTAKEPIKKVLIEGNR